MFTAPNVALRAPRNVAYFETFIFNGFNFTGAELILQIRLYPDAPGDPLVELEVVTVAGDEGILITVDTSDILPVSTLDVVIAKSTMQGLPAADPPDSPNMTLAYDLISTGVNYPQAILIRGSFTVEGSVTR